ncbi:MAG TPA: GYDIA family GHMP kinase [Bacteroidales bacterium]|nr:GYDIA family GHMP kinase [Bacteroidales bacterium]
MKKEYYARGKILITSEFIILHGAKALAAPLTLGQKLIPLEKSKAEHLHWIAEFNDKPWFETTINLNDFSIIETTSEEKSKHLAFMIEKLIDIEPDLRNKLFNHDVLTKLEFNPMYGFGSSSTLTSLLAQWAGIDPMQYHFNISKGSGYDVACANASKPIIYQLIGDMPVVENIDYNPPFIQNMWLIYLGKKQVSSESVSRFLNNYKSNSEDINIFNSLTDAFIQAKNIEEAGEIIQEHENRISKILNIETLKRSRFPDLHGYVKSLGAWGGDFALLISEWNDEQLNSYLRNKNILHKYKFGAIVP